jgi:hypothetical protein
MRFQHWVRVRGVGRPTRIVVSTRVASAAVLGGGSPLIALAPALLDHLGDADLDRVVVHEWAHVQRRDDLAQFCQLVLRVIAGWHPAIWWLERRLELEREVACDEKVVAVTGSARDYALCLTSLAALRNRVHALPVPAAISSSGLRTRVVRILGQRGGLIRPWRAIAICGTTALATLSAIIGGVPLAEPAAISLGLVPPPSPAPMFAEQRSAQTGSPVYIPTRARTQSGERPGNSAQLVSRVHNDRVAALVVSAAQSAPAVIDLPSYVPEAPVSGSIATSTVTDVPAASADQPDANASAGEAVSVPATARDPWIAVADAGVAVGRGSQNAGVATAGFFTRFGKKIANSF